MKIEKLKILIKELESEVIYLRYEARNSYDFVERSERYSEADGVESVIFKLRKMVQEEDDISTNQET